MELDAKGHNFINTEGNNFLGTVFIGGTGFHITAVQVKTDKNGNQCPVNDPYDRLGSFYAFDETGCFETVRIKGIKGSFVVFIHPFMD